MVASILPMIRTNEGQSTTGASGFAVERSSEATGTAERYAMSPAPASVANTSTIQRLGGGMVLVHPLFVRTEQIGGQWSATSLDLALVAAGDTEFEALEELRETVLELYQSLEEMRDTLGPHLLEELTFLDRLAGRG